MASMIGPAVPAAAAASVPTNETYVYVYIPADMSEPMEERTGNAMGGLDSDDLMKTLKAGEEMGPVVDITALTVPNKRNNFIAISVYVGGNAEAKQLPVNRRVTGLMVAAGLNPGDEGLRGPAVVSRYFDNDDAWHRIDIRREDCTSDADWVRSSLALNKGRKMQGSSLSNILKQQASQIGGGGGGGGGGLFGGNGDPVVVDGRSGGAYGAEALSAAGGAAGEPGAAVVGGDGGATDGGGCDWVQTGDEIELTFPVPEGATKKNVRCAFKPDRLDLSFEGHEGAGLKGDLGGLIDIDGCGWTIGEGKIVVTMEKKVPDVEWGFALKKD